MLKKVASNRRLWKRQIDGSTSIKLAIVQASNQHGCTSIESTIVQASNRRLFKRRTDEWTSINSTITIVESTIILVESTVILIIFLKKV